MRQAGVVAIVLVGLTTLLKLPVMLSGAAHVWTDPAFSLVPRLAWVGAIATVLFIGLFLILARERISQRLFGDSDLDIAVDSTSLLQVVIIGLGLYMLPSALKQIVFHVTGWVVQSLQVLLFGATPDVLGYSYNFEVIDLSLGIALVLGGGRLARALIPRARFAESSSQELDA